MKPPQPVRTPPGPYHPSEAERMSEADQARKPRAEQPPPDC